MKNTKFMVAFFAFAFAFTFGVHFAFATTVDYAASNFTSYTNAVEGDCFNLTSDANCPIGVGAYWPTSGKNWVNTVTSPLYGTSTETDLRMGFGFRATTDMSIGSVSMPILTNNTGAQIRVDVVLGDNPNASSSASVTFAVPRTYTENQKTVFTHLMDDPQAGGNFAVPVPVHSGEMVWFRLNDGSVTSYNDPTKFYGFYYVPIGCDPYNGCISVWANGTSTSGLFIPSTENQSRNIIGLRYWEGNEFHTLGQFIPLGCDVAGDCSWRYGYNAGMSMVQTLQFSVNTGLWSGDGTNTGGGGTGTSTTNIVPPLASDYFPSFVSSTSTGIDGLAENVGNFFRMIGSWISGSIRYLADYAIYIVKWIFIPQKTLQEIWAQPSLLEKVPFVYVSEIRMVVASSSEAVAEDSGLIVNMPAISDAPLTVFTSSYFSSIPVDVMAKVRIMFTMMLYFATMITLYKIAKQI